MQKLNNISLLRVVAMICIFFCHVVLVVGTTMDSPYWYFPLHFGVQIFMFVTGYLYGKKDIKSYKEHIKKRFTVILIPYYIFIIVLFAGFAIYDISLITLPTFLQGLFCVNIFGHQNIIINHFWYLFYILVSYIFIPWLIKLRNHMQKKIQLSKTKVNLIYTLIIFLVVLEIACTMFTEGQVAFTCLIIGFFFGARKNKVGSEEQEKVADDQPHTLSWKYDKLQICLYTALFLAFSVLFFLTVSDIIYLPTIWDNLLTKYSTGIVGVTFSILFISAFKFLNTRKLIAPIRFLDGISYYFYITHQLFVVFGDNLRASISLIYITPYLWLNIIIAFAAALACACLLKLASQPLIKLIFKKKEKPSKSDFAGGGTE